MNDTKFNTNLTLQAVSKVHTFWEGHNILRNLHRRFVLCSASQIYGGDFAKFCGLLRIYELLCIVLHSTVQLKIFFSCSKCSGPKISHYSNLNSSLYSNNCRLAQEFPNYSFDSSRSSFNPWFSIWARLEVFAILGPLYFEWETSYISLFHYSTFLCFSHEFQELWLMGSFCPQITLLKIGNDSYDTQVDYQVI